MLILSRQFSVLFLSFLANLALPLYKDSPEDKKAQWENDKTSLRKTGGKVQHFTINTHLVLIQYNWMMTI